MRELSASSQNRSKTRHWCSSFIRLLQALGALRTDDVEDCELIPPRVAWQNSPLFELARLLVRLDHVASFIVNANHSVVLFKKRARAKVKDARAPYMNQCSLNFRTILPRGSARSEFLIATQANGQA